MQLVVSKNWENGVFGKKKRVRFFLTLFHYMISPASSDAVSDV